MSEPWYIHRQDKENTREEEQERGDKAQVIRKDHVSLHRPQSKAFDWLTFVFAFSERWSRRSGMFLLSSFFC